jgi:hypothetical protein
MSGHGDDTAVVESKDEVSGIENFRIVDLSGILSLPPGQQQARRKDRCIAEEHNKWLTGGERRTRCHQTSGPSINGAVSQRRRVDAGIASSCRRIERLNV